MEAKKELKTKLIQLVVTESDLKAWRAAATADGRTLSNWIQWRLAKSLSRKQVNRSESHARAWGRLCPTEMGQTDAGSRVAGST